MNPSDEATRHAEETYQPGRRRSGIALALSGGGYRAFLFHLGAIRRLNQLGALSRITTVSSVSGGSIMSAFLADRLQPWPDDGASFGAFETAVAVPMKRLAGKNIRTWPIAKRLLPWNLLNSQVQVQALAETYRRQVTRLNLRDLPALPKFVYCATDLPYAVNWVFEGDRMGDYQAGYQTPPADWPLALAVAASSCFPPVFTPLKPDLNPEDLKGGKAGRGTTRDEVIRSLSLSDGGVYDNMGLEPVWKDHAVLLVSDGGATFDSAPDSGLLWQVPRYIGVTSNQAAALRKRWLIAGFLNKEMSGAYWGIGSSAEHYGFDGGYSEALVEEVISEVRTDLDAFSTAEQCVLENHGYVLAEAAVQRHAISLISAGAAPFAIPYPEWMDEARVRTALKDSAKQKKLGRW